MQGYILTKYKYKQTYPPLFTFNGQLFNGKTLKLYYQTGKKSTIETCFLWIVMEGIVLHSCWNKCKNNKNFFQTRGHPSSNFLFASQKK